MSQAYKYTSDVTRVHGGQLLVLWPYKVHAPNILTSTLLTRLPLTAAGGGIHGCGC